MIWHYAKYSVRALLFSIVLAVFFSAVFWFFAEIMLGFPLWKFSVIVRWTYIACASLLLIADLVNAFGFHSFSKKAAQKWGVTYDDVIEAFYTYDLYKEPHYEYWSANQFRNWCRFKRALRGAVRLLPSRALSRP